MRPETVAGLAGRWVRLYTKGLPAPIAERRVEEVDADLHEHLVHARADGTSDRRTAFGIVSRVLRGLPADVAWRDGVLTGNAWNREETTRRRRTAYRRAVGAALAAALVLVWLIGAVGLIGSEGDEADRMYGAVLVVGAVGAAAARLRPSGMAWTLVAMALAQTTVGVVAIAGGMVPDYNSPFEILVLNGFFATLFVGSAWLFRRAALHR